MGMTICSDKNGVVVEEITLLNFEAHAKGLREAAVLWREAIGQVRSLSDSLVGRCPLCADELRIDLREHRDVRKFTDPESLEKYKAYLSGLVHLAATLNEKSAKDRPEPEFVDCQSYGFSYRVSSGRAGIVLDYDCGCGVWRVRGFAKFVEPSIVRRNLARKGFMVTADVLTLGE